MRVKLISLALGAFLLLGAGQAFAAEKLLVYTSMKESLMNKLKEGFERANPGISLSYQSAGAGMIMSKLASERSSGRILADVVWTSEVPDFYVMKKEGILEAYIPPEIKHVLNPFTDYDGSFTAIRLGTLGIAYNTDRIKTPPASWADLTKPEYRNAFSIANPALSGTSYMSVALLASKFGWEYFERLAANGAKIGTDSGRVVTETASGLIAACLAVDYITNDKITKGDSIALAYPPEMLVVPSPAAIMKDSQSPGAAKKFVDYLLSADAQAIIASAGTIPVRSGVPMPGEFNLPNPDDALRRAIPIDYVHLMEQKDDIVKRFTETLRSGQ